MTASWHERWDKVVLAALGGLHVLLSVALLPSGLLGKYPRFAELLAFGSLSGEDASPASPLYLLLHLAAPAGLVRWLQTVAAVGAMVLLYRLGRRLRDPLTGLLCAGNFALSAPVLIYGATLEPDLLLMVAGLLGVWGVVDRGVRDTGEGEGKVVGAPRVPPLGWRRAALVGASFGVAIALRPTAALVALVILGGMMAGARAGGRGAAWRPVLVATAALAVVAAAPSLVLSTLTDSNAPGAGTMSPGAAFYDGNRPESPGIGVVNPWLVKALERQGEPPGLLPDPAHALYRRFARVEEGASLTLAEVQSFWAGKSLAFAAHEPAAFASLLSRKLLFLLAGSEYHDVHQVRRAFVALRPLPLVRHSWVFVLGLAGMLVTVSVRSAPWWLWGYWGAGAVGLLAFSVMSRYAMILFPPLVLFGGIFLREAFRVRKWRPGTRTAAAALLALLPVLSTPVRRDARIQERVLVAHEGVEALLRLRADPLAGTAAYVQAQSIYPFLPSIMDPRGLPFESPQVAEAAAQAGERRGVEGPADAYLQAVLWEGAGSCERALPFARRSLEAGFSSAEDSRFLDPHLLVARCLRQAGDSAGAMDAVMRSLEAHPATADGLALALAGSDATGLAREKVGGWEERLRRIHDGLSADFALLRAYREWGNAEAGLELAEELNRALPGAAAVEYETALLHIQAGNAAAAFQWLERARSSDPSRTWALAPFRDALRRLAEDEPGRREVWVARVDQAAQEGRFREAHEVASAAAERFLGDEELRQLARIMSSLAESFPGSPR